ncbi:Dipeptide/tripeptide permease [Elusimicrobium minutum Pei191]|uniref:Dipeptide/tripeptide permease n=1 Tax=Elusimicrobium minutum (strain Pei191) TaxID=445932 RepID=B2KCZ3_ELUMP|nr:peptide MFS transporter [Elusimicrobium minutum]ACC98389.1 Dipeptide/tripeptide permease [Elusimicrobium minutum Pei191]
MDTNKNKQPPALFMLSGVEMWERFNYYGMRALLVLFMTSQIIGLSDRAAGRVYGLFGALVYLTPVFGGLIADAYLGKRKSIIIGAVLMMCGQFVLASYGFLPPIAALAIGLTLIIAGNGFFKPNISSIVGELYDENDNRRDAGFTIFYMGINIGAFLAPLVCGYLGEKVAFRYGFLAAGIGMLISLVWFIWLKNRFLGDIGIRPAIEENKNDKGENEPLTKVEKDRILAIFIFTFFSIFFWAFYEQAGSSLTLFADRSTDRVIFGWEMPTSFFQSFPALLVVLLAPVFAWLWRRMGEKELSTPAKFAWGLALLGIGYIIIAIAAYAYKNSGLVSIFWLCGLYLMHVLGELCISPVGLSMITKLSPAKYVSLFMGVWFASDFFGGLLGGFFAGEYNEASLVSLFSIPAATALICALIIWALSGKLKKWMHGIN